MSLNIVVIDYGMGNLHSVAKALQHADRGGQANITVSADLDRIRAADKIVLPGVGAMRDCMGEMQRLDLTGAIQDAAQHKPFLGICIGMQAMLNTSDENDGVSCLKFFDGHVRHFNYQQNMPPALKIPHMGWNQVTQTHAHPLWDKIDNLSRFYFVHSYIAVPEDTAIVSATSEYGITFTAAMAKDNIFATQFHPEKSAAAGLQLFSNFIQWDGQV